MHDAADEMRAVAAVQTSTGGRDMRRPERGPECLERDAAGGNRGRALHDELARILRAHTFQYRGDFIQRHVGGAGLKIQLAG
ncbi:MAG: hypothetical protein AAB298_06550, partial [Pseudomonadota bacterium]